MTTPASVRAPRRTPLVGGLVAEGISFVGTRISMIAIPWFVLSTTGSPTQNCGTRLTSTVYNTLQNWIATYP